MRRLYVLFLLISFSTHIFSAGENEGEKLTARGAALIDQFREKSYAQLESELQQCKGAKKSLEERHVDRLKEIKNKLQEYEKSMQGLENDFEHQLMQAHSFEGWLSHRATGGACMSVILLAAYKKFAMPRFHAWARKIHKPTWKKRMLQLLACDWWQRMRFARRRGKKRNA